jgi:hypothetical protein
MDSKAKGNIPVHQVLSRLTPSRNRSYSVPERDELGLVSPLVQALVTKSPTFVHE